MGELTVEKRISDTLHERATRDVAYDLNLWPRISSRVDKRRVRRGLATLPFMRPNVAVVAYLAVLVVAVAITFYLAPDLKGSGGQGNPGMVEPLTPEATAVAVAQVTAIKTQESSAQVQFTPLPTLTPDATATQFSIDYNTERQTRSAPYWHVKRDSFGKNLHLFQTVDGYTIVVKWAYADGNQVVVNFAVEPTEDSTPNTRYEISSPELSIDNGPVLKGSMVRYDTFNDYYLTFYSESLLDSYGNQESGFHLSMMLSSSERIQAGEPIKRISNVGPFEFRFSVPFIPARVAEVNQMVSAEGIDITLQEVRVTPAGADATFLVETEQPIPDDLSWQVVAAFDINSNIPLEDWEERLLQTRRTGRGFPSTDGLWAAGVDDNLYEGHGEWTLTISRFEDVSQTEEIKGPWVFKFEVPPLDR